MTEVTNRDSRQWRAGENEFDLVTVKGADPETYEPAQMLQYDPVDDKYFAYAGAIAADRVRALANLDEDFIIAGATEDTFSVLIQGKVFTDKIPLPAGVTSIDDRPNGALLSIREQLRDVGIIAVDSTELSENNITA